MTVNPDSEPWAEDAPRFVAAGLVEAKRFESPAGERVVLALTREQARAKSYGSALGLLFASRRPRLGFTRIQQRVLEAAVDDQSDEEIADQLGLSTHAIKMRWRTIYDRIDAQPDLASAIFQPEDRPHPGASGHKRRHIVAFVRARPEELRPFAHGSMRSSDPML